MAEIIVDIDYNEGELVVEKKDNGLYDIIVGGKIVQPNHDAEGVMRALAHYLHSTNYKLHHKNKI